MVYYECSELDIKCWVQLLKMAKSQIGFFTEETTKVKTFLDKSTFIWAPAYGPE